VIVIENQEDETDGLEGVQKEQSKSLSPFRSKAKRGKGAQMAPSIKNNTQFKQWSF